MRFFKGLAGVLAGTGLIATGATVVVGCGEDFDGCQASRTCKSTGAGAGGGGMAGTTAIGDAGNGGKGGSAGSPGGKGGGGGKAGNSTGSKAGRGGAGGRLSGESGNAGEAPARGGDAGRATAGAMTSNSNGGESGQAGDDTAPPLDDEPPRIIATSPANGEKGVLHDADIVVTFSESMDTSTIRAAYSSIALPLEDVELLWGDDNGKTLIIRPRQPLEYAEVDSFVGAAKLYGITIGGTATDLAGNPLGEDRTFVFSTMRYITDSLEVPTRWAEDLYHPTNGSDDYLERRCATSGDILHAGDTGENVAMAAIAGFDLGSIPDGVLTWSKARVVGTFTDTSEHVPFGRLGHLAAHSIVGHLADFDWKTPYDDDFPDVATYPSMGDFNVNVLDAVKKAYEHRNELAFMMLFRFDDETDDDDTNSFVRIPCGSLRLSVIVTAP